MGLVVTNTHVGLVVTVHTGVMGLVVTNTCGCHTASRTNVLLPSLKEQSGPGAVAHACDPNTLGS